MMPVRQSRIKRAMIMGAGNGVRMRPLTSDKPKPLVPFMGRPLIDHVLDRLEQAGIDEVIVNVHAFADMLEAHLAKRSSPHIVISDERGRLLDTGGGTKKALPLLGHEPIVTFNSDSVWIEGWGSNLARLCESFDPERMDALLMMADAARTIGFVGRGDFRMDPVGRLARRGSAETVPFTFAGVQVIKPALFEDGPDGPFSTNLIWDRLIDKGTLFGQRMSGVWMHVGTPEDLADAESFLRDL